MEKLLPQSVEEFVSRFQMFYDAVIRQIHLRFRGTGTKASALLIIESQDRESNEPEGWVHVHIRLRDVKEWCVVENDKESYQILSNGLCIGHLNNLFYIDISGVTEGDASNMQAFKSSQFYFASKDLYWTTKPCEGTEQVRADN